MSRVITFATRFPGYHPRAGQLTHFREEILFPLMVPFPMNIEGLYSKHHTIRKTSRWKPGERFSPRFWSGTPRRSKQEFIFPQHEDLEIKKVWTIEIMPGRISREMPMVKIDNRQKPLNLLQLSKLANNDGLSLTDFIHWFNEPFTGQIICWNSTIKY